MSTVVRPSGPLPPRVYWLRRLLLLVVVAALVWGVARVVGGGDPANGEPAGDGSTTHEAAVTPEADDHAARQRKRLPAGELREQRRARLADSTKARRSARVREVAQTLEGPTGPCDLTLVRVSPEVPSPAYAGTSVLLRLRLRTEQAAPCTIDLDADRLVVSVSSVGQAVVDGVTSEATEIVWSTAQCRDAVPGRTVVLRPSWTSTVDLSWSGLRSGHRCRADRKPADAGPYRLQVAALTGEPAAVDFELTDPLSMDRPVDQPDRHAGEGEPDRDRPAGQPDDAVQAGQDTGTDEGDDAAQSGSDDGDDAAQPAHDGDEAPDGGDQ